MPEAAPEDIRKSTLSMMLRRLLRRADEGSRSLATIEAMVARVRKESRTYWEMAQRESARTFGADVSTIRLPLNTQELEEVFWRGGDATIREALKERENEPNGEKTE